MTILKQLRERSGRNPNELAIAGGINLPSYRDLEDSDSELTAAASIDSVARIARELGVAPSVVYGGKSSGAVSTQELASLIRQHIDASDKSTDDFEEQIGWNVAMALSDPEEFRKFSADCMKAICSAINIDWFNVLDAL